LCRERRKGKEKGENLDTRKRWLTEITEKLGLNFERTLKLATNRNGWRKAVHEVTRSQLQLDGR